jgi:hypothetical protein
MSGLVRTARPLARSLDVLLASGPPAPYVLRRGVRGALVGAAALSMVAPLVIGLASGALAPEAAAIALVWAPSLLLWLGVDRLVRLRQRQALREELGHVLALRLRDAGFGPRSGRIGAVQLRQEFWAQEPEALVGSLGAEVAPLLVWLARGQRRALAGMMVSWALLGALLSWLVLVVALDARSWALLVWLGLLLVGALGSTLWSLDAGLSVFGAMVAGARELARERAALGGERAGAGDAAGGLSLGDQDGTEGLAGSLEVARGVGAALTLVGRGAAVRDEDER